MADTIGRAVLRASRTSFGFVVAPSLHFHQKNHATVAKCIPVVASTRRSDRCGRVWKSGLSAVERISPRQVHALASDASRPAVVADDEEVAGVLALEGVESGGSQLRELCAGKVPEYLLRR